MALLSAYGQVVAPVFNPSEANFSVEFPVTVTCATPGAQIHYTLDGAEPTQESLSVDSGGQVLIYQSSTLKAKAWLGAEASAVASSDYNITGDISIGSTHVLALKIKGESMAWGQQEYGRLGNGLLTNWNVPYPVPSKKSVSELFSGAVHVAAGHDHSLVLDANGAAWAFGRNNSGHLGNNTTTNQAYPVRVLKSATAGDFLPNVTHLGAGTSFSTALDGAGQVWAWGSRSNGRLGDGSTSGSRRFAGHVLKNEAPAYPSLSGIQEIESGATFVLARAPHSAESPGGLGRIWAWGLNSNGQLGNGNTTQQARAVKVMLDASNELRDATDAAAGLAHSVVVRWKTGTGAISGQVWCFGQQADGRLGNNLTGSANRSYPVQVVRDDAAPLEQVIQVAAGPRHTLALDSAGNVWAWGSNASGELGDGSTTTRGFAAKVKNPAGDGDLANIVKVYAGGEDGKGVSYAVAHDGTVYSWGYNQNGQLGLGKITTSPGPLPQPLFGIILANREPQVKLGIHQPNPQDPTLVRLVASVADLNGPDDVNEVRFYHGTSLLGTVTASPWILNLTSLPLGSYANVTAVAEDSRGAAAVSAPVSFQIPLLAGSATAPPAPDWDLDGIPDSEDEGGMGDWSRVTTNDGLIDPEGMGVNPNWLTSITAWWDFQDAPQVTTKAIYTSRVGAPYHLLEQSNWMWSNRSFAGNGSANSEGVNSYYDLKVLGENSALRDKRQFSVGFWVKLSAGELNGSRVISLLTYGDNSGALPTLRWYVQRKAGGGTKFGLRNPQASVDYINSLNGWDVDNYLDDGKWHHLLLSMNNSSTRMYMDGVQLPPVSSNLTSFRISNSVHQYGGYMWVGADKVTASGSPIPDFKGEVDGLMVHHDSLSALVAGEIYGKDRDLDGISDVVEVNESLGMQDFDRVQAVNVWQGGASDSDGDGLSDLLETSIGTNRWNPDTDGDLLPDDFEHYSPCLDPLVAETYVVGGVTVGATLGDPDADGLTNLEEYIHGTNPCVADSDGDLTLDGVEVERGTDPLDITEKPFHPEDHAGPVINDANMQPVGNLGVTFSPDNSEYRLIGGFGDHSGSESERWELSVGSKRLVNQEYGKVQSFDLKLNMKHALELKLRHVSSNGPWDDPYYPNLDYKLAISGNPGFILVDLDELQGEFLIEEDNLFPFYWVDKRAYLIPTKSLGYSQSFSGGDAVGPRYRKVALTGRPLPDEKPEEESETEVYAEETYIDAFDLSLHHDTSFAHIPIASSDLVIEATASVKETTWSNRGGLRPHEELTSPFGVSWSSNLCSYIEITQTLGDQPTDPISVNVVDEAGRGQRFGTGNMQTFFPWPSSRVDKKTFLNRLEREGADLVLYKKYGNKLTYRPSNAWFMYSSDRLEGGDTVRKHVYYRLEEVEDRYGNKLVYNYGGSNVSLIPTEISALGKPGQKLTITRSTNGRRVTSITDARNKTTQFNYTDRSAGGYAYTTLDSVSYSDGTSHTYIYEVVNDAETVDSKITQHYHCNIKAISDKRGNTHTFNYAFDRTKSYFTANDGRTEFAVKIDHLPQDVQDDAEQQLEDMNSKGDPDAPASYRLQYGQPRVISSVTLPASLGSSSFAKTAGTHTRYGPVFSAASGTTVTDAAGNVTTYAFEGVHGEMADIDVAFDGDTQSLSVEWMVYYTKMIVNHAGLGTEEFEYDLSSGLSLSKMKDFSGGETTWTFGDSIPGDGVFPLSEGSAARAQGFMSKWADPTSKTDALGRVESYEYGNHRVMTLTNDVHGTITSTVVDALGRRKNMIVHGPGGVKLREETYLYDNEDGDATTSFPGFMVEKRIKAFASFSGKAWEQDLVTRYIPDSLGRVWKEIVDPGGLDLTTVTTYDLHNNKLTVTDPNGNVTTFHYDDLNRLYKVDHPATYTESGLASSSSEWFFDANGSKAVAVDENGGWTIYQRDARNRVVKIIRDMDQSGLPSANSHRIISESSLNAASVAGAADIVSITDYNAVGTPVRKVDPRGSATILFVDALQRPVHRFAGVPAAQAVNLSALATLAEESSAVTHEELSYELSVEIGGQNYDTSPGASGFSSEGFKPTKLIRHHAVHQDFSLDSTEFVTTTTVAVYDEVYRPLATSEIYALGAENRTITAYGAINAGKEALTTTVTDHLGKVTESTSDGLGRAVQVREAVGSSLEGVSYSYHSSTGLAWRSVDELGRASETEFDAAGRAIRVYSPDPVTGLVTLDSPVSETQYDANGNAVAGIDPLGRRTDTDYDPRNRAWRVRQPAVTDAENPASPISNVRPTTITRYDGVGNVTSATDPRGATTRSFYDAAHRVVATRTNPVTGSPSAVLASPGTHDLTTSQSLDKGGLVLDQTDANGNVTRNAYDLLGRLTATITNSVSGNPDDPNAPGFDPDYHRVNVPNDILVTNEYDDMGNLILVTDGKGQRTGFTYDGQARKTRTIWDPGTAVEKFERFFYDAKVLRFRSTLSVKTDYIYDDRHRLVEVIYGSTVIFGPPSSGYEENQLRTYDIAGKLLTVTYPNDPGSLRNVANTYDKLDRLTSETSAGVTHTHPAYDKVGNRLQTTYGRTGRHLVSTYDALNRLATLTEKDSAASPTGRLTTYAYDLNGGVTRKVLPNGNRTDTSRDFLGRSLLIEERTVSSSLVSSFDYSSPVSPWPTGYDGVGNVLKIIEQYSHSGVSNRTVSNTYDRVNRLQFESIGSSSPSLTLYGYDQANNRTLKHVLFGAPAYWFYSYGNTLDGYNSNQLKSATLDGVATTFHYYPSGNRMMKAVDGETAESYLYDSENRLIALFKNGTSFSQYFYLYDHRSRRVLRDESSAGGSAIELTFAAGLSVQEATTAGSVQVETIRGSDWGGGIGGVLYTIRGGGTRGFNAYNSRGDVVSTTDDTGASTWQAAYEAFGTRTAEQGTNQERQRANTKDEDPTGLLNEGMRYRDLEFGIFLTRDPAGFVDGPNVYTYVRQNPWTKFDPLGLKEAPTKEEIDVVRKALIKRLAPKVAPKVVPAPAGKTGAGTRGSTGAAAGGPVIMGGLNHGIVDARARHQLDVLEKSGMITPEQRTALQAQVNDRSSRGGAAQMQQHRQIDAMVNTQLEENLTNSNPTTSSRGQQEESNMLVNRIGGGSPENLALKPAETKLSPPGISVLLAVPPEVAAGQMRAAFPNATGLQQLSNTTGVSTIDRIRATGFDVMPDSTARFPNHGRIIHPQGVSGFNPANLQRLSAVFADIPTPSQ